MLDREQNLGAGCNTPDAAPLPGDVRLVDLEDTPSGTSPCDEVHFGGVEIFNRGRWGAICTAAAFMDVDQTREATVVCGQLGFPFGSVFSVEETYEDAFGFTNPPFPNDDTMPSNLSWSAVACNGTEQRLEECSFSTSSDGTFPGLQEESDPCFRILGVVCHRFELAGAASYELTSRAELLFRFSAAGLCCHVACMLLSYTRQQRLTLQSLREVRCRLYPQHCRLLHRHHHRPRKSVRQGDGHLATGDADDAYRGRVLQVARTAHVALDVDCNGVSKFCSRLPAVTVLDFICKPLPLSLMQQSRVAGQTFTCCLVVPRVRSNSIVCAI